MTSRTVATLSLALAACAHAGSPARAAIMTYTSLTSFQASTAALSLETFDGFPTGAVTTTTPVTSNGITVSVSNNNSSAYIGSAIYGSGKSLSITTSTPAPNFTITLSQAVTALSLDIFDLGTVGATTLSFTLSNGDSGALATAYTGPSGGMIFRGLTDTTAFTSISFTNSVVGDFIEFDNLRYGMIAPSAVPEPGSLTLVASAGSLALGAYRVRRRRAA